MEHEQGAPSNLVSTTKVLPFMVSKACSGLVTFLASCAFAGLPSEMSCVWATLFIIACRNACRVHPNLQTSCWPFQMGQLV